ncbi:MAG: helix-turn-helix domain-containing protein [Alphaproteobacteria bacterium]|nr:MAG: helix-turn-helix domain-containing protein [Alphaproteobacteria bacterium]
MTDAYKANDVVDNTPGKLVVSGPSRILGDGVFGGEEVVWLIRLPSADAKKPTRTKDYVAAPTYTVLTEFMDALADNHLYVLKLAPDPKLSMTDEVRLQACSSDSERQKQQKKLDLRDKRFAAIRPLLFDEAAKAFAAIPDVLADPEMGGALKKQAEELGVSLSTLYKWRHRYWAQGSQKNALLDNYDKCGNPGQPKEQRVKLGRSTRAFKAGLSSSRGFALSEGDKRKLAFGYSLITHSLSPRDAYLLTCSIFWAEHVLDAQGNTVPKLFEKALRPTFQQFKRWGRKLSGKTVTEILFGPKKWRQSTKSNGGSEQDSIVAVGQQAQFDGTSSDVYLASYVSRLKKLPPMTRLMLKESRTGIIYGLYCGWKHPSPSTALHAILHGAMECKVAWAARFGIDIPPGSIPGLLARTHLADNGELKAEQITEAEEQFGFGVTYTPTFSGDRKGSIETQHHKDHAHLDKHLPGATHGKPKARGQEHAALGALWNYYEYMRELIRYIVWHNTVEEVPDLAPDDMLLAEPRIAPTRINTFNWLTKQRMNRAVPVDYQALRAFTLPDVNVVIRKNGIYIEAKVHGKMQALPRLRYTSAELVATGLLDKVKQTGKVIHTRMKMSHEDLSEAWLPTKAGMIRVATSARDLTILSKLTLEEWVLYLESEALRRDLAQGATEQTEAETLLGRMATTAAATAEAKAELEKLPNPPAKKKLTSNLDQNRKEELELLDRQEAALNQVEEAAKDESPSDPSAQEEWSASDDVMSAFHADAVA